MPIQTLVPGDLVRLSAGDLVPADLRLLTARDLQVDQAALTGEAMPVEKSDAVPPDTANELFDLPNICFMGSNVLSGAPIGIILQTGRQTYFGRISGSVTAVRAPTSFD